MFIGDSRRNQKDWVKLNHGLENVLVPIRVGGFSTGGWKGSDCPPYARCWGLSEV